MTSEQRGEPFEEPPPSARRRAAELTTQQCCLAGGRANGTTGLPMVPPRGEGTVQQRAVPLGLTSTYPRAGVRGVLSGVGSVGSQVKSSRG